MKKIITIVCLALGIGLLSAMNVHAANVGKPQNLRQENHSNDWVGVTWNDLHNADDWEYKTSTNGITWEQGDSYCRPGMLIYGVEPGTSIWFKVRGIDKDQYGKPISYGDWSEPIELVTSPDVKVSDVTSSGVKETGFTLKWKPVFGANSYKVKIGDKEYFTKTNKITIKGLKRNSTYDTHINAGRITSKYKAYQIWGEDFNVPVKPTKIAKYEVSESYRSDKGDTTIYIKKYNDSYSYRSKIKPEVELWTAYGKSKKLKTFSSTSYYSIPMRHSQFSKNSNKVLKVRVRYKVFDENGKVISSSWSDWKYIVNRVNYNKVKLQGKKVVLSWKKISGVSGYKIYSSKTRNGKYKLIKTTSSTSYKENKRKSGSTKYYKVVPFTKLKGKKVNVSTLDQVISVYISK